MSKKTILAVAVATLAFGQLAKAQTNIQVFYDFAQDRQYVTTTIEGFYGDKWGNTFFFVDHDFNNRANNGKIISPNGTYMEIARCLNFWQNTKLGGLSAHVEYNGGIYNEYSINHAVLAGLDYFFHSKDYKNTLNVKVLYKWIDYGGALDANGKKVHSAVPMQFTLVWGMQDLFGLKGLRFSGFADFWWESHTVCPWLNDKNAGYRDWTKAETSQVVFISEPQLWYNIGRHFGVDNLNIGSEVEFSYNFAGYDGFHVRPCIGTKWVF